MIRTIGTLKAWGNSIGLIIPKDDLTAENLGINDEVEIIVRKKQKALRDAFGFLKGAHPKTKKSTDELLKEIDRDLKSRYDDL